MSYVSLGGIEPWGRVATETDEVYVWVGAFKDAPIKSFSDAQAIAAAAGQVPGKLDLIGIAISPVDASSELVQAVFKAEVPMPVGPVKNAEDFADHVKATLLERFPKLSVEMPVWMQITDDEPKHPALDFWLGHSIIWDKPTFGLDEKGKPTYAFARGEGIYRGTFEQGMNLKPWPKNGGAPGPGPKNGTVPGPGTEKPSPLWALAGVVIAVGITYLLTREQGTIETKGLAA